MERVSFWREGDDVMCPIKRGRLVEMDERSLFQRSCRLMSCLGRKAVDIWILGKVYRITLV